MIHIDYQAAAVTSGFFGHGFGGWLFSGGGRRKEIGCDGLKIGENSPSDQDIHPKERYLPILFQPN